MPVIEKRTFVSLRMIFVPGQDTQSSELTSERDVNCVIISPRAAPRARSVPVFIMFTVHSSHILVMDVVISAGGQTRQIFNSRWISFDLIVNRRYKDQEVIFISETQSLQQSVTSALTCELWVGLSSIFKGLDLSGRNRQINPFQGLDTFPL